MRYFIAVIAIAIVLTISSCSCAAMKISDRLKADDLVTDMINHPAFEGFGRYLMPTDGGEYGNLRIKDMTSLLPYHSNLNPNSSLAAVNHMIGEVNSGKKIFYTLSNANTGLFFFRGKPGSPFAVICPGGGFSYVGSLHEGFPYALELSKKGYNAFVLKYRTGGERIATEDLAAAVAYIFKNAKTLEVGTKNYSLWGSSAGARMAANIGSDSRNLPKPSAVVMAYTGHASFSKDDPPTFVVVGDQDGIVNIATVERRVKAMKNAGIDIEYKKYKNIGHGFGLGVGTVAEGWFDEAIKFWRKHILK